MASSETTPWFVEVLDGGSIQVPDLRDPIDVERVSRGNIEVRSGTMRVGTIHTFTRGEVTLDAPLSPGVWTVATLVEATDQGLGALAEVVESSDRDSPISSWVRATTGGRPIELPAGSTVMIGDGDLELSMGGGPPSDAYPRLPVGRGGDSPLSDEKLAQVRQWRLDHESPIDHRLPEAILPTYQAPMPSDLPLAFEDRSVSTICWWGLSADGKVAAVVVDSLTGFFGANDRRLPSVIDPWETKSSGSAAQGAELAGGDDFVLESADLTAACRASETDTSRRTYFVGRLPLHSHPATISGGSVGGEPPQIVVWPVSVATGDYPVYAVAEGLESHLFLFRMSSATPVSWLRWTLPPVQQSRGARLLLGSEEVVRAVVDQHLSQVTEWLNRSGIGISAVPSGGMVLLDDRTGGFAPEALFLGTDAQGRVVALLLALHIDALYSFRPASEDEPIERRLKELPHDNDAQLAEDMEELEHLASVGDRSSYRKQLHMMAERYLH